MAGRHGITFFLALAVAACGSNAKEINNAKHSVYDTDFAIVYNAALDATRSLYSNMNDAPGPGRISTAWHEVRYSADQDADMSNQRTLANAQGINQQLATTPGAVQTGMPTRLAYKRYYIRFDVRVVGGRPWHVKVIGHAAEWSPGAAYPVELHGIARPHWLQGRTEALEVGIYRRIKEYAKYVPDKPDTEVAEDSLPKTDPTTFKTVPAGAAKTLAEVSDILKKRDYNALRGQLSDDIVWSLGGGTGADIAMATWQADPGSFDAMAAAIAGGCTADGDKKAQCPGGAPKTGTYQLTLEARGDAWKVTSFVRAE
ncbi:MAG: hypothetical protein JO257_22610 [Deltaproteobacteria bacterium]|nr:hypothetical protein [Deltaproteobacteria bacterium]